MYKDVVGDRPGNKDLLLVNAELPRNKLHTGPRLRAKGILFLGGESGCNVNHLDTLPLSGLSREQSVGSAKVRHSSDAPEGSESLGSAQKLQNSIEGSKISGHKKHH